MGSRLAGVIETESEIPHSMLEEKNVWIYFILSGLSYVQQGYINFGLQEHLEL